MPPARMLPSDAAVQNASVGTLSFGSRRSEHFRRHTLVWLQAQRILRFRTETKYRRLQTAAEVFSPAL